MATGEKLTYDVRKKIYDLGKEYPDKGARYIAKLAGVSKDAAEKYRKIMPLPDDITPAEESLTDLQASIKKLLNKQAMTRDELADALDLRPSERSRVDSAIESMKARAIGITLRPDSKFDLLAHLETGGSSDISIPDRGDGWQAFGFTSDNHLCNKNQRLDVLNKLYDIFAAEGLSTVYNAGNMVDGEARFNRNDLLVFGMDRQLDYFIEHFPQRPGITTHFITGDDHEGWWAQRECINIGQHLQSKSEKAGRLDLKYLSNVEHDVSLKHGTGESVCRIMHPGGGSAYAYSYTSQKIVESLQGGEKPAILLAGHYHKMDYCTPRNVHVVQTGTTEDQTTFMRKKKIEAHVGGGIVWFKQDEHGAIARLRVEYIPFFDRGYYERKYE